MPDEPQNIEQSEEHKTILKILETSTKVMGPRPKYQTMREAITEIHWAAHKHVPIADSAFDFPGTAWLFENGELKSIPDLFAEVAKEENDVYRALGFDKKPDIFGTDGNWSVEIYGPTYGHEYQWMAQWCIEGQIEYIWFRSFAQLHDYLIYAAPLINLLKQTRQLEE